MTSRFSTAFLLLAFVALGLSCNRNEPNQKSGPETAPPASHDPQESMHDAHDQHAAHAPAPKPQPGQLWTTDEPLRTAMQRIRDAVDRFSSAQEKKQLASTDAHALAVAVEENVNYMIANCKLEPQPDAALHALIGRMLSAVAALKQDSASDAGVAQLRVVLSDYQSTFDHPGW